MKKQKEVYGIIYVIRNKVNNKLYIGQTINKRGFKGRYPYGGEGVERVYKYHKHCKDSRSSYNEHLLNSIEKYGFNTFKVIEEFDIAYSKEELNKLEYMYIKVYNTDSNKYGYNNREGGENGKLSEETKQKMKENHADVKGEKNPNYGKHLSEETKNKISNTKKGQLVGEKHPMYGKHHTEEAKEKNRQSHLRENLSKETRNKMSEKAKMRAGENHPMYGKLGELNPNYGKRRTKEMKEKVSGKNNYRTKIVYCEELNKYWFGSRECAEELNLKASSIRYACQRHKKYKGYTFKYINEKELEELMIN
ncbi:MAG: hypothetical protein MSA15_20755 [Clostridium sp.]|nr:hypothetical protein [Clostridium sp.]